MSRHKKPSVPFHKHLSLHGIDNIIIKGKVLHGGDRFNIWLQRGDGSDPEHVALVFDVRFSYGSDRNLIVCNDRKGGKWGSEERNANAFPFTYGEKFKMTIELHKDEYKIKVGEHHIKEFHHRMPVHDVDTLRVDGKVELEEVKIETILD
ncbi:hypothetical protein CHS0354_032514 [Potamilus streckersoni]|uniref:Galectin n=1 Tax=Potamilus streckersoni TaxID=2493646 RepID=A0AAE0SQN0_9BIVA|nr:hypothetical protein CHS0354_032514 [Potamilus streckersoni]